MLRVRVPSATPYTRRGRPPPLQPTAGVSLLIFLEQTPKSKFNLKSSHMPSAWNFATVTVKQNFLKSRFERLDVRRAQKPAPSHIAVTLLTALLFTVPTGAAETNLLKNPGFEEAAADAENPPAW